MTEPTSPEQKPDGLDDAIEGGSNRNNTSLDNDFFSIGPDRFGPPVDGKKLVRDGGSTGPKTPLTPPPPPDKGK